MNPYQLLIPQLLAGLVIVVIARRAVRQSRLEKESEKEEIEKRRLELERYLSQVNEAVANPSVPANEYITEWDKGSTLQITLTLANPDSVADVAQIAQDSAQLLAGVSRYEEEIGGRGFVLTEARAERGVVVLNLTPKDAIGAKGRVKRIVEALNAAFDKSDLPSRDVSIPDLGYLPADVSGAQAVVLAA
ncbi:MAG TPA: hypothetical protein VG097_14185 [Gemmata sp.]|jgi:hypothetical protein|nr:hypothetical protein [Gemmata sp.]